MAPELFDGGQVTEKVDVFSYGVLCWEMLTGQVPWGEVPSPMQIIYYVGVLAQRPPLPPTCPEYLKAFIETCWAESPAARPSFKDIRTRLKEMQGLAEASGQADLVMPVPATAAAAVAAVQGVEGIAGAQGSGHGIEQTMSSFSSFALHSYNSSGPGTAGSGRVEGAGPGSGAPLPPQGG